jgi:hypothetical protein
VVDRSPNDAAFSGQTAGQLREIMAQEIFQVTGATGATGSYAVERLLERGHAVQALAHREDDRSKRLQVLGAEVVIGDLLKLNDVRLALGGIRGAYFVYPLSPTLVQATAITLLKSGNNIADRFRPSALLAGRLEMAVQYSILHPLHPVFVRFELRELRMPGSVPDASQWLPAARQGSREALGASRVRSREGFPGGQGAARAMRARTWHDHGTEQFEMREKQDLRPIIPCPRSPFP